MAAPLLSHTLHFLSTASHAVLSEHAQSSPHAWPEVQIGLQMPASHFFPVPEHMQSLQGPPRVQTALQIPEMHVFVAGGQPQSFVQGLLVPQSGCTNGSSDSGGALSRHGQHAN